MKLTLLGTGIPLADPARRGPSQVIEAGNDLILIDVGAGAMHRLVEAGHLIPGRTPGTGGPILRRILFTHLHSDHSTGLADLLWAGWVQHSWDEPPIISGPPGTAHLVEKLIEAYQYDIGVRTFEGGGLSRETLVPRVEEIEEGWQAEGDGWQATAFRVEHEPVDQAFGFRIDDDAASVVVSGDTRSSENLIKHSQDADILVHEVFFAEGFRKRALEAPTAEARRRAEIIQSYHTGSDVVGRIAEQANARHLLLSHLILSGGSPENLLADIAPSYHGKTTVGEDLMSFDLVR